MLFRKLTLLAAGGALALVVVGCGSGSTPASTTSAAATTSAAMTEPMTSEAMSSEPMTSESMSEPMTSEPMTSEPMTSESMTEPMTSGSEPMTSGSDDMAGGLVGAGCADYAKANPSGAGSVDGMAKDPVATAAANNPLLTTLVAAVSGKVNPDVDLVDTLNDGEFTVFAPIDSAFESYVDAATLTKLQTDKDLLTKILTYHVIAGQLSPEEIVGTHTTVEGGTLEVTGSGDELTVNGNAVVVCGGVKTANATVYLIDHVLMPSM